MHTVASNETGPGLGGMVRSTYTRQEQSVRRTAASFPSKWRSLPRRMPSFQRAPPPIARSISSFPICACKAHQNTIDKGLFGSFGFGLANRSLFFSPGRGLGCRRRRSGTPSGWRGCRWRHRPRWVSAAPPAHFGKSRISTWALIHHPDNQPPTPLSSIERTYLVAPELASADDYCQVGHRVRRRRVWGLLDIWARSALRAGEHRAAEPLWKCVCIM